MNYLIKILTGLIFCAICTNLLAQSPKVLITKEEIQSNNIGSLVVTLDSASEDYQLPFDTVTSIKYDDLGNMLQEIGVTSDVCYIQNRFVYSYFPDSVRILEIDSSFNCPAFMTNVDTSIRQKKLRGDLVIEEAYYPWSNNGKLEWTKIYAYDDQDKLKSVTQSNEIWQPEVQGVTATSTSRSMVKYFYNDNGEVDKIISTIIWSDGTERKYTIAYTYHENRRMQYTERQDFEGNTWNYQEETLYDDAGSISKIIEYGRDGTIRFTTEFAYDKNGLLRSETAFKKGNQFSYRFVTSYQQK